jgi:hypothetical protein
MLKVQGGEIKSTDKSLIGDLPLLEVCRLILLAKNVIEQLHLPNTIGDN